VILILLNNLGQIPLSENYLTETNLYANIKNNNNRLNQTKFQNKSLFYPNIFISTAIIFVIDDRR
jgi:hypothetical protein